MAVYETWADTKQIEDLATTYNLASTVQARNWAAEKLLDALLQERGYEAQQVDMTLAPTKDGGLTPCGWTSESDETPYTIYVPVQGEGE